MKKYLQIIGLILLLASCEKALLDKDPASDPKSVFEYLWNEVQDNYSYFEEKDIDWDSVYTVYSNRITNDLSNEELFDELADMLNILHDGHVNLVSSFNISYYDIEKGFDHNYDNNLMNDYYLETESENLHTQLASGLPFSISGERYYTSPIPNQIFAINDIQIGYIRYAAFEYEISEADLDYVLNRFYYCDAIIIDIRDNGGGDPTNLFRLLARFIDERSYIYTTYLKNSAELNDFTAGDDIFLDSADATEHTQYFKPVKILTNRSCFSASSFFAAAATSLHQQGYDIELIGDVTGGGAGAPGGGQLPNGWYYRLSVTKSAIPLDAIDYERYMDSAYFSQGMYDFSEGLFHFEDGVPPHILVNQNTIDYINHRDMLFETALDTIYNSN